MSDEYDIWQTPEAKPSKPSSHDSTDIWAKAPVPHSGNPTVNLGFNQDLNQGLKLTETDTFIPVPPPATPSLSSPNLELLEQSSSIGFTDSQDLALTQLENHHQLTFNSAHSIGANQPSLTINQYGSVYRHDADGSDHFVGTVRNNTYYNLHGHEIGYLSNGHYYDSSNHHQQGSVCGGEVFNNHHHKIAIADTATEGGAWMAFIEYGGIS